MTSAVHFSELRSLEKTVCRRVSKERLGKYRHQLHVDMSSTAREEGRDDLLVSKCPLQASVVQRGNKICKTALWAADITGNDQIQRRHVDVCVLIQRNPPKRHQ